MQPGYAELHCLSNFTFLRGASHPQELVMRAAELGYSALALTDECSLAGIVRAWEEARERRLKLIVGSEIQLSDGPRLILLATNHDGYTQLCRLISDGRRAADKGSYRLSRANLVDGLPDCLALWVPEDAANGNAPPQRRNLEHGPWVARTFPRRAWIALTLTLEAGDASRRSRAESLSRRFGLPIVATGAVHMHERRRQVLQDTLSAVRLGTTVADAGPALFSNGERHLRPIHRLTAIYRGEWLAETLNIAARCDFSLAELRYQYPEELVPSHLTPSQHLRQLTYEGMGKRWPGGVADSVKAQVEHELSLIEELSYEAYFLTVHDLVRFARGRGILCQGRGSAANSAVCYSLGVTEVDPARASLLFERFISKERNEPPDIDVDFEHERREEVIQYVYRKYGRHRAALTATVISYRTRSAVRDIGKALGFSPEQVDRLSGSLQWWDGHGVVAERAAERGFDPDSPQLKKLAWLVGEVSGFPRHLSQHVGGFVMSQQPLHHLVPVENAAMPERTIVQWDKDDLDTLGILKVDCLALGMLTCIHRAFDLIRGFHHRRLTLADIPEGDTDTYRMIQAADTVGVFQVESRAQMSMLPRLRPENFYDLVIEVAIVRPGPIQGNMVHPYLRRRQGKEPVVYPSEALRRVLERTLGIPIFQEQVMQIAIVAAGFSPGEADRLRRAMAAWKRRGGLEPFRERLLKGMLERGYQRDFAESVFNQMKGFADYGFPESHAASFALLVYVSAWLKRHYPAAFTCALLNSLPMGFYSASQLVQDVRRHGVEVRPVDVCHSRWDSHLERRHDGTPAIRLGMRVIKGMREESARRIMRARRQGRFSSLQQLVQCADLDRHDRHLLSESGALRRLLGHRNRSRWESQAVERLPALLADSEVSEQRVALRVPTEGEDTLADYARLGLTLGAHPLALLRGRLRSQGWRTTGEALKSPHGRPMGVAGLVTLRQRPSTASGVVFVTLEDEDGMLNVVVWPRLLETQRRELLESSLLGVRGVLEREEKVCHLIARQLIDLSDLTGDLHLRSRDFC